MVSLRDARIAAGKRSRGRAYTQQEVADAFEISRRTLGRWETGDIRVGMMALYALAYYYNIDVETLDPASPDNRLNN